MKRLVCLFLLVALVSLNANAEGFCTGDPETGISYDIKVWAGNHDNAGENAQGVIWELASEARGVDSCAGTSEACFDNGTVLEGASLSADSGYEEAEVFNCAEGDVGESKSFNISEEIRNPVCSLTVENIIVPGASSEITVIYDGFSSEPAGEVVCDAEDVSEGAIGNKVLNCTDSETGKGECVATCGPYPDKENYKVSVSNLHEAGNSENCGSADILVRDVAIPADTPPGDVFTISRIWLTKKGGDKRQNGFYKTDVIEVHAEVKNYVDAQNLEIELNVIYPGGEASALNVSMGKKTSKEVIFEVNLAEIDEIKEGENYTIIVTAGKGEYYGGVTETITGNNTKSAVFSVSEEKKQAAMVPDLPLEFVAISALVAAAIALKSAN